MIYLNDIHDALEGMISAKYPGAPVYHDVLPKDFNRPSFYVEMTEFTFSPEDGTPSSIMRQAVFKIVAFVAIDAYHNGQVSELDTRLDVLAGLFAPGFLRVGDRAPHAVIRKGEIVSTDAAQLTIALEWWEDLDDFAGIEPVTAPDLEHVEIAQQ